MQVQQSCLAWPRVSFRNPPRETKHASFSKVCTFRSCAPGRPNFEEFRPKVGPTQISIKISRKRLRQGPRRGTMSDPDSQRLYSSVRLAPRPHKLRLPSHRQLSSTSYLLITVQRCACACMVRDTPPLSCGQSSVSFCTHPHPFATFLPAAPP